MSGKLPFCPQDPRDINHEEKRFVGGGSRADGWRKSLKLRGSPVELLGGERHHRVSIAVRQNRRTTDKTLLGRVGRYSRPGINSLMYESKGSRTLSTSSEAAVNFIQEWQNPTEENWGRTFYKAI